jgi:hypothetical protein
MIFIQVKRYLKNFLFPRKNFISIKDFWDWPKYEHGWAARLVIDSEINWMYGPVPIADL